MKHETNSENKKPLWTRDFTILTLGSVVSMLGNAMAGFALSLFVLDYTGTPFFYALYIFLYTLPQIVSPLIAGPLMDRFSRRRTIYMLDFFSTGVYLAVALLVTFGLFNFVGFALMALLIGTVNGVYWVAYDSFYPMLISEGNYSRAYSVSSVLETLSMVMIPVSALLYNTLGLHPILFINAGCFLLAALFETQISDVEKLAPSGERYNARRYLLDAKEGLRYLASERGLLLIALYFVFSAFCGGASSVITLPWFRQTYENGEYIYISVWAFMALGRVIGGALHYRLHLPAEKKFLIALTVYVATSVMEGVYLYTPLNAMRLLCFLIGILAVTSYNIRLAATQSYVPNEKRGRFNGAFVMLNTVGSLGGELLGGVATTFLPMRPALSVFMGIGALAAVVIVGGGRKHIAPIYNREL